MYLGYSLPHNDWVILSGIFVREDLKAAMGNAGATAPPRIIRGVVNHSKFTNQPIQLIQFSVGQYAHSVMEVKEEAVWFAPDGMMVA